MPRKISCGGCAATYSLADSFTGKAVKCKKCGVAISVVTEDPVEEDPAEEEVAQSETPPPVAERPARARGKVDSGEIGPVKVRSRRERALEKSPPFYTQPMFFVYVVATLVCAYLAIEMCWT